MLWLRQLVPRGCVDTGEGPLGDDTASDGWYIYCCWAVVSWVLSDFPWGVRVDEVILVSTFNHATKTVVVGLVGGNGLQFVAEILLEIANVGCCWMPPCLGTSPSNCRALS